MTISAGPNLARKSTKLEAWGRKGVLKSARRRAVPPLLRRAIRARAGDRCEDCKRPLKAVSGIEFPEQWTDREVLDIYRDYPCHRCGFRFPVIDAPLDDDDLGRRIQEHFPAFYKDHSHTLRQSYWANHCPSCGALQGSYWIMETVFDREPDDSLTIAPWRPRKTQERYVRTESFEWGNFHHLDEDPSNNKPENIRLLCVRCHAARHKKEKSDPTENRANGEG
jgi:hypothetical protein